MAGIFDLDFSLEGAGDVWDDVRSGVSDFTSATGNVFDATAQGIGDRLGNVLGSWLDFGERELANVVTPRGLYPPGYQIHGGSPAGSAPERVIPLYSSRRQAGRHIRPARTESPGTSLLPAAAGTNTRLPGSIPQEVVWVAVAAAVIGVGYAVLK